MDFNSIPYAEVYRPTPDEFANFQKYLEQIEKKTKLGIVKVGL